MFDMFNNGFLRHPQYKLNPCYRKVICYSFFMYLKENAEPIGETTFKNMLDQIENNQLFWTEGLLGIYPTAMDSAGNKGCLAVDPSGSCFPLVLYPYSRAQFDNVENKTRLSGFKTAAGKEPKNWAEIFMILTGYNEWTFDLEANLEEWFEYPKRKTAANCPNYNDSLRKSAF